MQRCFIAFELDQQACEELSRAAQPMFRALKAEKPRLLQPIDYHSTLKFLGSVEQHRIEALTAKLDVTLSDTTSIMTHWAGFGGLPRRSKAHVLVAVLRDDEHCAGELQRRIEAACADLGFVDEQRPYKPHITLARFKKAVDVRQHLSLARTPPHVVELSRVVLYRSTLAPGGAKYSIVKRFELAQTAGSPQGQGHEIAGEDR